MKSISKLYRYNDDFFHGKIPTSAINVRPQAEGECPVFIRENLLTVEQCRFIANSFVTHGPSDRPGTRGANANLGLERRTIVSN
jgi:hypothetical protein